MFPWNFNYSPKSIQNVEYHNKYKQVLIKLSSFLFQYFLILAPINFCKLTIDCLSCVYKKVFSDLPTFNYKFSSSFLANPKSKIYNPFRRIARPLDLCYRNRFVSWISDDLLNWELNSHLNSQSLSKSVCKPGFTKPFFMFNCPNNVVGKHRKYKYSKYFLLCEGMLPLAGKQ